MTYRFEDRTEENIKERNRTEEYLACFDLKNIYFSTNIKEIGLNQLNWDVYNFDKLKHSIKTEYLQEFNKSILVPIKPRECLVFRSVFCFPVENKTKFRRIDKFSNLFKGFLTLIAYKNDTFDLVEMKSDRYIGISVKFDQQIVLHRAYPYSNCIESYSRFHCLNNCFKSKDRLSKYLYKIIETNDILLKTRL